MSVLLLPSCCRHQFLLLTLSLLIAVTVSTQAEDTPDLARRVQGLQPGQTLEIEDGRHEVKKPLTIRGVHGTEGQPVILRAAHRGQAIIEGVSGFVLKDCQHVVIEGFTFENDADQQCVLLENCQHVRVTRNIFRPKERAKPRHWEHWVTVEGSRSGHNRIDHNLFERKVNRGSPLFIRGDDTDLVCSQHDRIDHNHFRDVVYANRENGHETLRTGGNDLGAAGCSSFTIIEYNLLERCSGEDEILSLKSSDNIVRHNTLINCRGAICLRLGNRSVVADNIILATEDGPGFGGIKLFGFQHRVTGNYLAGLTGTRHEAPFSLVPGMYDTPTTDRIGQAYDDMTAMPPTDCHIENNTWLDCSPLQFGFEKADGKWVHPPKACIFTKNRVLRTRPFKHPLVNLGLTEDLRMEDNVAYEVGDVKMPDSLWAKGFRWEKELPVWVNPTPLTSAEVGPEAK